MSEATGTRAQRGTAAHPISSVCPRDGEDKKVVSGSPGLRGCATGHPRPGGHSPWVAAGAVGERRAAFPGPRTCAVRASARDGAASCLTRLTLRRAGPQAAGPFCGTPAFSPPRRLSRPGAERSCSPLTAPWLPVPPGGATTKPHALEPLPAGSQLVMERAGWVFHRSAGATTTRHPLLTGRWRAQIC